MLRHYAGRTFPIARAAVCWGPADAFLGRLAATAGRLDVAEEHFRTAIVEAARIGAHSAGARARAWYAELLRARSGPGDAEQAAELQRVADEESERMGLAAWPMRIASVEQRA